MKFAFFFLYILFHLHLINFIIFQGYIFIKIESKLNDDDSEFLNFIKLSFF